MKTRMPVHGSVPVAILLDARLTFADLKVYTVLSSFQGSNDDAYPSREAIVDRCGLVVETVSRAVKHLMELGWIQRDRRGLGKTNIYRVMVECDFSDVTPRSLQEMASGVTTDVTPRSLPSNKTLEKNTRKRQQQERHKYGEYRHVLLSTSELEKLKSKFPLDWAHRIEALDRGIELKGYKYKNFYLAILEWDRHDKQKSPPASVDDSWRFKDPRAERLKEAASAR